MRPQNFDPTAGERARAIREGREVREPITDPTAGERARAIGTGAETPCIVDPTDPRYGQPVDLEDAAGAS